MTPLLRRRLRLAIIVVVTLGTIGVMRPLTRAQAPASTDTPGQTLFTARCGFCHGRDAAGGETGPDLTSSAVVKEDVGGDKLIPVIRDGRINAGMPAFALGASDLEALVAFMHDQHQKAEAQPGRRRGVTLEDLQTGNAAAGTLTGINLFVSKST